MMKFTNMQSLVQYCKTKIKNFSNLNPSSKFEELLFTKDIEIQKALALFLVRSDK